MSDTQAILQRFSFLKSDYSYLQALENTNKTQAVIHCQSLGIKDGRQHYHIYTPHYKQSNTKGIFGWVNDVQFLKSNLEVSLTPEGHLEKVLNTEEIKSKWHEQKKELARKHKREKYVKGFVRMIGDLLEDEPKFTASLRYVSPYILLFSGFSKQTQQETCYREISNFVGAKTIPIIAATEPFTPEDTPEITEIKVNGKIDQDNFEQEKVTAFVRTMRDNLRAKAEVQLRYSERYAFNGTPLPIQAMCMSTVVIPGFLYREEESHLKAIK